VRREIERAVERVAEERFGLNTRRAGDAGQIAHRELGARARRAVAAARTPGAATDGADRSEADAFAATAATFPHAGEPKASRAAPLPIGAPGLEELRDGGERRFGMHEITTRIARCGERIEERVGATVDELDLHAPPGFVGVVVDERPALKVRAVLLEQDAIRRAPHWSLRDVPERDRAPARSEHANAARALIVGGRGRPERRAEP
jgi:hypothetical protein